MRFDERGGRAVAAELMAAMTRLRARLRTESKPSAESLTWSQLTTLGRIVSESPTTVSQLAAAEHVRRQSMAETVATLRAQGLVMSQSDPQDGRRVLISATPRGELLSSSIPAAREAWLSVAIHTELDAEEMQVLRKSAAIINRLADSRPERRS